MAMGTSASITGNLSLTDKYQLTNNDDILNITGATITLNDPAGEIFTDKGNDTVTVTDSTITDSSISGAELMFSMGSDNDSLNIANSTLSANTFMGSGNDTVTVSGDSTSNVIINKQFSLGTGDDVLTLRSILSGNGNLVFGDGNDTLIFDGGQLKTTGSISGLTHLTVQATSGVLGCDLTLSGIESNITINGNLTGYDAQRVISASNSTITFTTANNVKTNVAFSFAYVTYNHIAGGSLEISENSNWAFSADNSTVTIHDAVIGNNYGGLIGNGTNWDIKNSDISANSNGGVFITGGSVAFSGTDFSQNKLSTYSGVDTKQLASAAEFAQNLGSTPTRSYSSSAQKASPVASSYAAGGAVCGKNVSVNLSSGHFSGNIAEATASSHASGLASARATTSSSLRATAIALATANPTAYALANGGALALDENSSLTMQDVSFNGNKVLSKTSASAYGIAKASAYGVYAYASAYFYAKPNAVSVAQGGALYLNAQSTAEVSHAVFSGNSVEASASASSSATSLKLDSFPSKPQAFSSANAKSSAQGGAVAITDGANLILSDSILEQNKSYASANATSVASAGDINAHFCTAHALATAFACGGAIYASSATITLNNIHLSANVATATASTKASASTSGYYPESFANYETQTASAHGGAIYAIGGVLNLNDTVLKNNAATASADTTITMGGAVYLIDNTMTYTVSSNKSITNTGNKAAQGGFIYLAGSSDATFQVDGTLTIGDYTSADSIAGSTTSSIIKTGGGTWTINSDIAGFAGKWNLAAGILKLARIARNITLDNWTVGVGTELHLSTLDDTITMGMDKKIGTINLGGGSDTINTGGYHLSNGKLLVSTLTLKGGGKVSSEITTRTTGAAFDITLDDVNLASNITGGNAADKLTITKSSELSGTINLGNGANTVTAAADAAATFSGTFTAGSGDEVLSFSQVKFEQALNLGNGNNIITATGAAEFAEVSTGIGNDTITIGGNAVFNGTVDVSGGNDTFTLSTATFAGAVNLGGGVNKITATNAAFANGITAGSGADSITLTGDSSMAGVVALGGGRNYIYNSKNLDFSGSFKLDAAGETHLIVYNGASLSSDELTVYADENAERNSVYMDWNDMPELDKVRILVSKDNTFETFEFTVELYNQTKAFTLNVEKGYYLQFQAQDEDGWSERKLTDIYVPGQVTGITGSNTGVSWNAAEDDLFNNGIKQYHVEIADSADFGNVLWNTTVSGLSCNFSDLADGAYYVRVQAEDYAGNCGGWSDAQLLNIDCVPPAAPAVTADITTLTNQNVIVTAEFAGDAVKNEYSLDGVTWSEYTDALQFTTNGTAYFRSTDAAGNVSDIVTYEVANIDKIVPDAPVVTANSTVPTNNPVVLSAEFTGDAVKNEFSLDGKNWQNYDQNVTCTTNGTVYFRSTDAAGNVSEVTAYEVNNIQGADLTVIALAPAADTVQSNQTLEVNFTVKNQGVTGALSSWAYLYNGDTLLGQSLVGITAAGAEYSGSVKINASLLPAGTHTLTLQLDGSNRLVESSKLNNTAQTVVTVQAAQPDLQVNEFNLTSSEVLAGNAAVLNFAIQNHGSVTALSSYAYIYAGDVKLGQLVVSSLAAGAVYNGSYTIYGGKLALGEHSLRIELDTTNRVAESDEANNFATAMVTIKPKQADLQTTSLTLSDSTVLAGEAVTLNFTVANHGTATALSSYAYIYDGDVKLGQFVVGSLAVDAIYNGSYTIYGGKLALGEHNLRIELDATNRVVEDNEANNSATAVVTIKPKQADLQTTSLTLSDSTVLAGEAVTLNFTVANKGTATALSSYAYIYDGNVKLGQFVVGSLAVDAIYNGSYTIAGGRLTTGTHNLRIELDATNRVVESNEANNSATATVTVKPQQADLQITSFIADKSFITAGDAVNLSFSIKNAGGAAALASWAYLYDGNKLIGSSIVSSLAAGAEYQGQFQLSGATLEAGFHNLTLIIDATNRLSESNENNNMAAVAVMAAQPAAAAPAPQWETLGSGDFDGDDLAAELAMLNRADGTVVIEFANSETLEIGSIDVTKYEFAAITDANSDGIDDLLWSCSESDSLYCWQIKDKTVAATLLA